MGLEAPGSAWLQTLRLLPSYLGCGELHGFQLEACEESGVRPPMHKGAEGSAHVLCLVAGMGVGNF